MRHVTTLLALVLIACGASAPVDAGPPDTGETVPPGSCAQRGDVGNDIGIGTFCTPHGRECSAFPMAALCLAAVAPTDGQWFCTRTCTSDAQCGMDAVCTGDARGRACVPARCAPPPSDAGVDDAATSDTGVPEDTGASVDAGAANDAATSADAG